MTIESRIQSYVDELNTNAAVSRSHLTLRRLYADFGHEVVEKMIKDHFEINKLWPVYEYWFDAMCFDCGHSIDEKSIQESGYSYGTADHCGKCVACGKTTWFDLIHKMDVVQPKHQDHSLSAS